MLIGLLSDTHIAWPDQGLPSQLFDALNGVDLILHAGDVWIPWVLDELESVAPVLVGRGDDDFDSDFGNDTRLAGRQTLHFDGITLWVQHIKPRYGLIYPQEQPFSYSSRFNNNNDPKEPEDLPNIVVFGHTHHHEIENYKGVLLVNPGSPTLPTYIPKLGTIGLLTIEDGKAEARIVQLK